MNWFIRYNTFESSFQLISRIEIPPEKRPTFLNAFSELQTKHTDMYSAIERRVENFYKTLKQASEIQDYDERNKILHSSGVIEALPTKITDDILDPFIEEQKWDVITGLQFVSFIYELLKVSQIPPEYFSRDYLM